MGLCNDKFSPMGKDTGQNKIGGMAAFERLRPYLRELPIVLLIILFAWIGYYKIDRQMDMPFYDSGDETGYYWTEGAFHFRHFEMVAKGKNIPEIDTQIQYPEGLNTKKYITPVMERVAGTIYRWFFKGMALHTYLIWFTSIFSSLSVIAIYLTAKFMWRSDWAAIVTAFFYTAAPASFLRTAGGAFIREDFALPFIFFSFACFVYCLRKDSVFMSLTGTVLLIIALASWHLTQFYLTLFIGSLAIVYLLQKEGDFPKVSLAVLTGGLVIASLTLPVLRSKYMIASYPLMVSYAFCVILWVLPRFGIRGGKMKISAFATILVFVGIGFIVQRQLGGLSYIYDFLINKVKYYSGLPVDPSVLPFEIKVTWSSSFVSPRSQEVSLLLSSSLFVGGMVLFWNVLDTVTRKASREQILAAVLAGATVLLFLLVYRLCVFAIFFLALNIGLLVTMKDKLLRVIVVLAVAGSLGFAVYSFSRLKLIPFRPSLSEVEDVLSYLEEHTDPNDAVLSTFELGASIAAYGDRPVILHPKFESQRIRDKVREVYTSLYKDPESFYQVCEKYGVDYFIYHSNMTLRYRPGSLRYIAGFEQLPARSAAAMLHFKPDQLEKFQLVHQNFNYRIFRIGNRTEPAPKLDYIPVYDLKLFNSPDPVKRVITDRNLAAGEQKLVSPVTYKKLGDDFASKGDTRNAVLLYRYALSLKPDYGEVVNRLGESLSRITDVNLVDDYTLWAAYGQKALYEKDYQKAVKFFATALHHQPNLPNVYIEMGIALMALKKPALAEKSFVSALQYNPRSALAFENLGRLYVMTGQLEKAKKAVRKSLEINPDQKHLLKILSELDHLKQERQKSKPDEKNKP